MLFKIVALIAFASLAYGSPLIIDESIEGRIAGGAGVSLGQVSSMASLRTLGNYHFCGGVILSNRWILTSGQCTMGRAGNSINVHVGTVSLTTGGAIHRSFNITTHPGFDRVTLVNDISLIFTATVISYNLNVQFIPLNANIIPANVQASVVGWGSFSQNGGLSPVNLQRLNTTTLTNNNCRAQHAAINANRITDTKICTYTRANEGTCFGDEGGPLIVAGNLVGISSWQVPCASGVPDVYERISSFRLWIFSITN